MFFRKLSYLVHVVAAHAEKRPVTARTVCPLEQKFGNSEAYLDNLLKILSAKEKPNRIWRCQSFDPYLFKHDVFQFRHHIN